MAQTPKSEEKVSENPEWEKARQALAQVTSQASSSKTAQNKKTSPENNNTGATQQAPYQQYYQQYIQYYGTYPMQGFTHSYGFPSYMPYTPPSVPLVSTTKSKVRCTNLVQGGGKCSEI